MCTGSKSLTIKRGTLLSSRRLARETKRELKHERAHAALATAHTMPGSPHLQMALPTLRWSSLHCPNGKRDRPRASWTWARFHLPSVDMHHSSSRNSLSLLFQDMAAQAVPLMHAHLLDTAWDTHTDHRASPKNLPTTERPPWSKTGTSTPRCAGESLGQDARRWDFLKVSHV